MRVIPRAPGRPACQAHQLQKPLLECGVNFDRDGRMSECNDCEIGRRAFLIQGALAAAALALAACSNATGLNDNGGGTISGGSASIKVSDYPALANVGGVAMLSLSGSPVAVVRTGTSTYIALSRICPHQGGTIGETSNGEFQCPVHGATFNLSGQWIGGQPTSNMRSYTTSYDSATGTLTIT